jgi:hypothetical protein
VPKSADHVGSNLISVTEANAASSLTTYAQCPEMNDPTGDRDGTGLVGKVTAPCPCKRATEPPSMQRFVAEAPASSRHRNSRMGSQMPHENS